MGYRWRSFRYIKMEISTGKDQLTLNRFAVHQTNYPLDPVVAVDVGDDGTAAKMMEVSVRTLRNCVFDGYSDCPFYEQLQ